MKDEESPGQDLPSGVDHYQARVAAWMTATFGPVIPWDLTERNFRFAEEAMELCQANGATAEEMHTIVDYVFGRSVGVREQEVGGVMVTLAALCNAAKPPINMKLCGDIELMRIEQPAIMAKIRAKQDAKPEGVRAALPGFAP